MTPCIIIIIIIIIIYYLLYLETAVYCLYIYIEAILPNTDARHTIPLSESSFKTGASNEQLFLTLFLISQPAVDSFNIFHPSYEILTAGFCVFVLEYLTILLPV